MFASPIIERELRIALRKHKAVRSRFYAAAGGVGVVSFFLFIGWMGGLRSWGRELHTILFYVCLYMAVVPPAMISVGLFSEERRNQTMELLYLAGVGPSNLFAGKLLGGVMVASCNLLALAPVLAVPFLSGGISLDLFLATIACFPALLLFVIGVGVLASVLCKDEGAALICAAVIGGGLCLATPIPFVMGKMLGGGPPFSAGWLSLSPAYGPYLVMKHFGGNRPDVFWRACGMTVGWAILCLGAATFLLKGAWRRELERSVNTGWRGRWESRVRGSEEWRTGLRRRVLRINPFQWLVEQDRRPVAAAWGVVGGVCVIWLLGWWAWPRIWPSPMNFYATAVVLIMGMELVMSYTAARRMGNDRRDGVLELLLTTPLQPEQIVDGQYMALRRLFRPVRTTVFALCIMMALAGLPGRTWSIQALISYGLIWCLFLWWAGRSRRRSVALSMWIGINSGRPAYAIFRKQSGWILAVWAYNLRNIFSAFGTTKFRFPTGSDSETVFVCFVAFITLCVAAATQLSPNKMRNKLIAEMRSIAREPVPDPHDPRFKKWVVTERLPRNAYEEMSERVRVYPQRVADAERSESERVGRS